MPAFRLDGVREEGTGGQILADETAVPVTAGRGPRRGRTLPRPGLRFNLNNQTRGIEMTETVFSCITLRALLRLYQVHLRPLRHSTA